MFGFGKKVEIIDINKAYEEYLDNTDDIIIINVDELVLYDERHIDGSENLPYRLVKDFEDYYDDKEKKYYIYSLAKGKAHNASQVIAKKGFNVYELSDYVHFKGYEDGLSVKKKKRNKRRKR